MSLIENKGEMENAVRFLIDALQAILGNQPDGMGYRAAANVLNDEVRRNAQYAVEHGRDVLARARRLEGREDLEVSHTQEEKR
jgi:hypothetical protein